MQKKARRIDSVNIIVRRVSEKRDDRQIEGVNIVAGGGGVGLTSREPMVCSSSFVFWVCGGISCKKIENYYIHIHSRMVEVRIRTLRWTGMMVR